MLMKPELKNGTQTPLWYRDIHNDNEKIVLLFLIDALLGMAWHGKMSTFSFFYTLDSMLFVTNNYLSQ
jgi:hypothetical protein